MKAMHLRAANIKISFQITVMTDVRQKENIEKEQQERTLTWRSRVTVSKGDQGRRAREDKGKVGVCRLDFFLSFDLFRASPAAYRGSQARGQIGATASSLSYRHITRSKLCLQPTLQLTATLDP